MRLISILALVGGLGATLLMRWVVRDHLTGRTSRILTAIFGPPAVMVLLTLATLSWF
jgi:hypothetical protein